MFSKRVSVTIQTIQAWNSNPVLNKTFIFAGYIALSWFYAVCSQVIIPLPFNLVPISLQPLPLLLAALLLGWHAVNAYVLYLVQGAFGLPFFAGLQGGLMRLLGPTGGYLIGFGVAMAWLVWCKKYIASSPLKLIGSLLVAKAIYFGLGMIQLSLFIPTEKLLSAGLYPFLLGDFALKLGVIVATQKMLSIVKR